MKVSDFDFDLPVERIAQVPSQVRDAARLLHHRVLADTTVHRTITDFPSLLSEGDLLVVNDTRVRAARLHVRRSQTGGAVELLVTGPAPEPGVFRALARPAKKLQPGESLEFETDDQKIVLTERPRAQDGSPGLEWHFRLEDVEPQSAADTLDALCERQGHMPLPPYVRRGSGLEAELDALDRERYQTVYANSEPRAVAAPTAGLHFTPELLQRIESRGVRRTQVTLHVGAGTFRPVTAEHLEDHDMHAETYELSESTAAEIEACRNRKGRVIAVGTTSLRTLESCAIGEGRVRAGRGETRLFLRPGSTIQVVDALLTNFHLPRSTLLMLVSALAGRERILGLYREAIDEGYRFYSYGDAMFLENYARGGRSLGFGLPN